MASQSSSCDQEINTIDKIEHPLMLQEGKNRRIVAFDKSNI